MNTLKGAGTQRNGKGLGERNGKKTPEEGKRSWGVPNDFYFFACVYNAP